MKKRSLLIIFSTFIGFSYSSIIDYSVLGNSPSYTLFGYVPGEYLGKNKTEFFKAAISINGNIITKIITTNIPPNDSIEMKRPGEKDYDVIYPGLFNLHNHTKQNVLGVWKNAKGQFQNRFEWRGWGNYKDSVSGNMNPWIGLGTPITCASFRFSELQAMALGTTYLQGPSSCVSNFSINRIEDANSFLNRKKLKSVQAPTDLIYPNEMAFVYSDVLPFMLKNAGVQNLDLLLEKLSTHPNNDSVNYNYETGLKLAIKNYCPNLVSKYPILNSNDSLLAVSGREALALLKDPKNLDDNCNKTNPNYLKFRRYVYFIHPSISGKKDLLKQNYSAVVAHLAEGRRLDPYNQMEFKLLRLLGLDAARVNLIHGVGITKSGFEHMAKKGMGLIWSPFSNHLLYNETVDIETAVKASNGKLLIALGSDWTPTGSRGTLEEVKMAKKYLQKNKLENIFKDTNGSSISLDEALYKMMTSNPAKMLGHEGEAGTIAINAAASLIVTSKLNAKPHTNLVSHIDENHINLVIVDGKPVYGNLSLVEKLVEENIIKKPTEDFEDLGVYFPEVNNMIQNSINIDQSFVKKLMNSTETDEDQDDSETSLKKSLEKAPSITAKEKLDYLFKAATAINATKRKEAIPGQPIGSSCKFSGDERKVFIPVDSKESNRLTDFSRTTGLDLDKVHDIILLLQGSLMTHSKNKSPTASSSMKEAAAKQFSPVYSCQDKSYLSRIGGSGSDATQLFDKYINEEVPLEKRSRASNRKLGGSNEPKRLAELYKLPYSEL